MSKDCPRLSLSSCVGGSEGFSKRVKEVVVTGLSFIQDPDGLQVKAVLQSVGSGFHF